MESSAMVTCSPVDSSTSNSRAGALALISSARASSRLVSPLIADTTTTMSSPRARAAATLSATALIRSTVPTEVPPYFSTIKDMGSAPEKVGDLTLFAGSSLAALL
jgi:hypothetical protein